MTGRNDPCPCRSGKKYKQCCLRTAPPLSELAKRYLDRYNIILKTPDQIEKIRAACKLTAQILDKLCREAKAGVTTEQLDALAVKLTKEAGAIAAPLGYGEPPFPKSICTSVDDVICHGIPNHIPLKEGQILNIDYSCILDGYFGDCSAMVAIGEVNEEKRNVVKTAYNCLMESIKILKPGLPLYAIGDKIEQIAAKSKCSVVYQFVGHGVGVHFHEEPQVYHHKNDLNIPLAPGMIFTIEPMINSGKPDAVVDKKNKWEARTVDGKPSAQWEHTLLITESGYEILTSLP